MTTVLEAPKTEASVMAKYEITKEQIKKAVETASLVIVAGPDDKKGMALARENRLSLQKMRTTIEKKHKELKAGVLAYGRQVDAVKNELTALITPAEKRLKEQEETAAREAERLAELEKQQREVENKRRCDLLAAIGVMIPVIELQFMDAVAFEAFYLAKKSDYDAAKKAEADAEAARKAEAERLAKVAAEQAERQAEIDRQQAELAKRAAEQQAELDRQKAEIEAKQKAIEEAENAEIEKRRKWRASCLESIKSTTPVEQMMDMDDEAFERHLVVMRLDYEKVQEQEAKAEAFRKEQEAKAEAERIAELAKDLQEKREREVAAEIARKEAEAKTAEEEKARIAALAPDREKIDAYINEIAAIGTPTLSSSEWQSQLDNLCADFIDDLRQFKLEDVR